MKNDLLTVEGWPNLPYKNLKVEGLEMSDMVDGSKESFWKNSVRDSKVFKKKEMILHEGWRNKKNTIFKYM